MGVVAPLMSQGDFRELVRCLSRRAPDGMLKCELVGGGGLLPCNADDLALFVDRCARAGLEPEVTLAIRVVTTAGHD